VFGSKFEAVTTLARHSLSQAVRRVVTDNEPTAFTPMISAERGDYRAGGSSARGLREGAFHNDKGVTGIYARWLMFEEKRGRHGD
jgi:hypothetical protein